MNITQYFTDVRVFCETNNYWNIPETEALYLYELIIKRGYKQIIEYGTGCGYSTLWLAAAAKLNCGTVITIESHKKRYDIARAFFKQYNALNIITQISGHCPECFIDCQGVYDFIFIDIVKKHYLDSFKNSIRLLADNGVIIADNILTHKQETSDFIDYIKSLNNFTTEIIEIGNGFAVTSVNYKN